MPLPQPAADRQAGQALLAACIDKKDFSDPAPPARIHRNVWYVGTCTVSVILITTPKGHILIDGSVEQAVPSVLANIRKLGFDPRDIRWIVTSHEHYDHVGGVAALKQATGAKLAASAPARRVLESGKPDPADSQFADLPPFTPVKVDRVIGEGSQVTVGPLTLTAMMTPGHTAGSTTWTWQSCTGPACRRFTYLDSLTALEAGNYKFRKHPAAVATFRKTLERVGGMDCGVMINPHPGVGSLFERLAGTDSFAAAEDCSRVAQQAGKRLDGLAGKKADK